MRPIITAIAALLVAGCRVETSIPEAHLEVSARPAVLEQIQRVIYEFAEENSFDIFDSDDVRSGDRLWVRFHLQREDGVMVTVDNLQDEGALTIFFIGKNSDAEWRQVKELLELRILEVLGADGELHEVPIEAP